MSVLTNAVEISRIVAAVHVAYITAVDFTDCGPDSDIPSGTDFSTRALLRAASDVADFLYLCADKGLLAQYLATGRTWDSFGHDYWLTRNGHGAGFWDRGMGTLGDELTKAAKTFGGADTYLGDDGLIYLQ